MVQFVVCCIELMHNFAYIVDKLARGEKQRIGGSAA